MELPPAGELDLSANPARFGTPGAKGSRGRYVKVVKISRSIYDVQLVGFLLKTNQSQLIYFSDYRSVAVTGLVEAFRSNACRESFADWNYRTATSD